MIIFMGVAGAGKSVQGKMLAQKLACEWISTGELLRSRLSGERREEMLQGKLLDDQEIIEVVDSFLASHQEVKQCVLDGFPRTLTQARWLLEQQQLGRLKISGVVHLKATKEVVKRRLLERGRPDDNETAIDVRFKEYESQTLPIVDWFKAEKMTVHEIDGEQSVDIVHDEIIQKLNHSKVVI